MKNVIIDEEIIQGKPSEIIEELKKEMILQIAQFDIKKSNKMTTAMLILKRLLEESEVL